MADRRSTLLAAVSFAAVFLTPVALMRAAEAANMSATPQSAEPDVPTKKLAVPVTTAAPPTGDNGLIVMPVPPQPSRATVDAVARETGNPINKPVTGASIEPEIVGGDKPLSLESLQATRPGSGLALRGLSPAARTSSMTRASPMARAAGLRRGPSRSTRCCAGTRARSTASTISMT